MLAFAALFIGGWWSWFPPLPSPLVVGVVFPRGAAGACQPLITTGAGGDGDFLAIRFLDEHRAVLVYDVWGVGGPESPPFEVRPGIRRTLTIEMPTLAHVARVVSREKRPLRVTLDGVALLDTGAFFHRREPAQLYFAMNPIGGTLVSREFRGTLATPTGRQLRGGPECFFSVMDRLNWALRVHPLWVALILVAPVAMGLSVAALVRAIDPHNPPPGAEQPPHAVFLATASVCTMAFALVLTGGTFQLFHPEAFGKFYDHQAASLLQGRLDVPDAALEGEAFVFEGKSYGYFGPTPALLRLPFVALDLGFGRLSRLFMVVYYVGSLTALYAVLIHAIRMASGARGWPSRFDVALYVGTAGLGTTLFFVASRAYVYHEAILCGVAFALWGGFFSLRYLQAPGSKAWIGALACGLFSVHARPPVGLFALCLVGCCALAAFVTSTLAGRRARAGGSSMPPTARRHLAIAALAGLGVLSFNGLSYLKFRSFEGAPLRYHIQYNAERLAAIEAKNFHWENAFPNFLDYFARASFELRSSFPYFVVQEVSAARYQGAKMDVVEPTVPLPVSMPAITALAILGGGLAFLTWRAARMPLGVLAVAAAPMTLALLLAVAISQRYTADFVPVLLLAAAFGIAWLQFLRRNWRNGARTLVLILSAVAIFINTSITLRYQGELVWGTQAEARENYRRLRTYMDKLFRHDSAPAP